MTVWRKDCWACNWGSTLEQVAQKYPGGLPYPTTRDRGTFVAHDIDVDADLFGSPDLLPRATFCFNSSGRLHKVFLQYLPEQHEQVLTRMVESLGQSYSTGATKEESLYHWSTRSGPSVGISIGKTKPKDWVILLIDPEPDRKR
jgi:hypothetical protein